MILDEDGQLRGVEAVVDKDYSAALLAMELRADLLLLLTGPPAIYRDWPGTDDPIREITASALLDLDLPSGSMAPKARAAARFVDVTGGIAVIGSMEEASELLSGSAGTRVVAG